jgi:hypothetical protein
MATAARDEALRAGGDPSSPLARHPLEVFFVHMHVAWLYVLHAGFVKAGTDYRYRLPNGRYDKVDGEPKTWDLTKSIKERWSNGADPVRATRKRWPRVWQPYVGRAFRP